MALALKPSAECGAQIVGGEDRGTRRPLAEFRGTAAAGSLCVAIKTPKLQRD
jgi:hypothetical protein